MESKCAESVRSPVSLNSRQIDRIAVVVVIAPASDWTDAADKAQLFCGRRQVNLQRVLWLSLALSNQLSRFQSAIVASVRGSREKSRTSQPATVTGKMRFAAQVASASVFSLLNVCLRSTHTHTHNK